MKKLLIINFAVFLFLVLSCKTHKEGEVSQSINQENISETQGYEKNALMSSLNNLNKKMEEAEKKISDTNKTSDNIIDFSLNFFKNVSEGQKDNICISPASLNAAMAMAYTGADGRTAQEMSDVLKFDSDKNQFHNNFNAYGIYLAYLSSKDNLDFNYVNRIFVEKTFNLLPSYISIINKYYSGNFQEQDFIHNHEKALVEINDWVYKETRKKIKDLLSKNNINEDTRAVLVNALYLKSEWRYKFKEHKTKEEKFFINKDKNQTVEVFFMNENNLRYKIYVDNKVKVLELPYKSNEISLLIVLPESSNSENIQEFIPSASEYKKYIDELKYEEVRVSIPKFKIEMGFSAKKTFQKMGIISAFEDYADFSEMTEKKDIKISDIIQKVFFEIDEHGTEAAAATAVVMQLTSMPVESQQKIDFIANKPFMFILKDNTFNTPLFSGIIINPK